MSPKPAPFGSWVSPITAASVAEGGVSLGGVAASADDIYWSEQRPSEGGRTVVVCSSDFGVSTDITPEGFNARTAVHEYGGGAWWVHGNTVFFANWSDQILYRQDGTAAPVPITPHSTIARGLRYADGVVTKDGGSIICVRERHVEGREAFNEIVVLPTDGSAEPGELISGNDFYAFPRPSPDETKLAWTEWSHPNMPWDGTFLYVCDLTDEFAIGNATLVAGSMDESIFQPQWSPDGVLHFISDRNGWWNIYRWIDGRVEPVVEMDADFGVPQWVFGLSTYTFLPNGDIVCMFEQRAQQKLGVIRNATGEFRDLHEDLNVDYTMVSGLTSHSDGVLCIVASPTEHPKIVEIWFEIDGDENLGRTSYGPVIESGNPAVAGRVWHSIDSSFESTVRVHKWSRTEEIDEEYISVPESIEFPSEDRTAHAFYYPPTSMDFAGPGGEKPPLIVWSHGGPTGAVRPILLTNIQYWTSRGFAIVDVNYGGSVGYGRDYRRLLNENWGVVDVQDCVNAAKYLAERGDVDPDRLAIRGGSAGGFTTLAALVFEDVFKAGANYFGVADFETFVGDTHKFESRYLDSLVGPYPETKDRYYERSPANFVDRISVPVITFQGTEDMIVPPSQSEQIVNALRAKKVPCAYVTYEGEQHGFRKAENIIHSLEAELYFYGRVFGFEPAGSVAPVEIENL